MHFGDESGVYVLNTWVKKVSARRNASNVTSRASRSVSPMLEQVSDEEDVQEIEERARLTTQGWTIACYTELLTSLRKKQATSRRLRKRQENSVNNVMRIVLLLWRKCKNISTRIFRAGAGANTVCLVVVSAPNIDGDPLVKTPLKLQLLQYITVSFEARKVKMQFLCWS